MIQSQLLRLRRRNEEHYLTENVGIGILKNKKMGKFPKGNKKEMHKHGELY